MPVRGPHELRDDAGQPAVVRTTVRRVWISLAESCPYQRIFAQVYENLRRWSLPLPLLAPS